VTIGSPSARAASDLQSIAGYVELRRRYLRAGLLVAMAVNLLGLLEAAAPAKVQVIRLAVVLFCAACTWRLRRGGDVLRLGQVVTVTLTTAVLAAALLRIPGGWPVSLTFIPLLVVFGTLVAGTAVACSPFTCGTNACRTTCSGDADCAAGFVCVGSTCQRKPNGRTCAAGSECASGNCVQGVCCNMACQGTCKIGRAHV